MEVTSTEKSDYLLIFCPVNSQVGADIAEALDKIPRKKSLFTSFSTAIRTGSTVVHSVNGISEKTCDEHSCISSFFFI